MSIKPRDFSRDITIGGEIQRELGHQATRDLADDWIRTTNNPYGENAQESSPSFNPVDSLIPAKYNTIEKNENWRWYRAHKPSSYDVTANAPGIGVDPNLVQIGNSPFWRSSNEPVDPWDCERWPNSPYCGGQVGNPFDGLTSGILVASSTSCETCVSWQANFLGIPGPVMRFCYRKDSDFCKVPAVNEANDPPVYPPGQRQPLVPVPIAPPNKTRFLYCFNMAVSDVQGIGHVTDNMTVLNDAHQAELNDLVIAAMADFSQGNKLSDTHYRQYFYEPGFVRVAFDQFSTAGLKSSGRGFVVYDYGVLPWENTEVDLTWVDYNYLRTGSYRKLSRLNNSARTKGFANVAWQSTNYPPLYESTETLTGGINVSITVSQTYEDLSVVWIVDEDCELFTVHKATYSDVALSHAEQIEGLVRPSFGYEGKNTPLLYDNSASNFFVGEPTNNWLKFVQVAGSAQCPIPFKDPTPVIVEPDPMDCCDEVLEQLDLIKLRLGVDEFPVDIPAALTDASAGQAEIENHAQFSAWFVRNLDALMGQFPIKVTIADSDPTKAGEQEVEIELPNLAEGLAEVFGLAYQSEIKADLLSEMLMRLIPEVIAGKNASIVAQSYAKANASYMGYPGNLKPTEVPSNFNLAEVTSLPEFLKESKGKLLTYHEESKDTLQDKLERLMFAAGIIKSVFMVDGKDAERLIDTIGKMFDDEADNIAANKRSWAEWLREMQKDTAPGNKDQRIVPDLVEQEPPIGPDPT